jgi:hypothetical protein
LFLLIRLMLPTSFFLKYAQEKFSEINKNYFLLKFHSLNILDSLVKSVWYWNSSQVFCPLFFADWLWYFDFKIKILHLCCRLLKFANLHPTLKAQLLCALYLIDSRTVWDSSCLCNEIVLLA